MAKTNEKIGNEAGTETVVFWPRPLQEIGARKFFETPYFTDQKKIFSIFFFSGGHPRLTFFRGVLHFPSKFRFGWVEYVFLVS